jgi:hypothetical protein
VSIRHVVQIERIRGRETRHNSDLFNPEQHEYFAATNTTYTRGLCHRCE